MTSYPWQRRRTQFGVSGQESPIVVPFETDSDTFVWDYSLNTHHSNVDDVGRLVPGDLMQVAAVMAATRVPRRQP